MSTAKSDGRPDKVTTRTVVDFKRKGEKISMITAYDFTMARIVNYAGIDVILVGDSASNVMAGHENNASHHPRSDDIPYQLCSPWC